MQTVRKKIEVMESELKTLKRIARCPHEPITGIGGGIQRARHLAGMSISQLSAESSIAKGNISRLETTKNANPTLHTMIAIAKALKVSLSGLLHSAAIK